MSFLGKLVSLRATGILPLIRKELDISPTALKCTEDKYVKLVEVAHLQIHQS